MVPVSTLVARTLAIGITAPVASLTVPDMVAVALCALRGRGIRPAQTATARMTTCFKVFMFLYSFERLLLQRIVERNAERMQEMAFFMSALIFRWPFRRIDN